MNAWRNELAKDARTWRTSSKLTAIRSGLLARGLAVLSAGVSAATYRVAPKCILNPIVEKASEVAVTKPESKDEKEIVKLLSCVFGLLLGTPAVH
jgi:hypothetical protein